MNCLSITLILLAALTKVAHSSKILLVAAPAISHVRYFSQVGGPLAEKGHSVAAVMIENCHKMINIYKKAGIEVHTYPHGENKCHIENQSPEQVKKEFDMFIRPPNPVALMSVLFGHSNMVAQEGEAIFANKPLLAKLNQTKFDLAIVDGFMLSIYQYILPYKLGIPYVTLTTGFVSSMAGVPDLPSLTPTQFGALSNRMSFFDRVQNTFMFGLMSMNPLPGSHYSYVSKYVPEKEESIHMTQNKLHRMSKLFLINTDVAIDYPRPLLPHVIPIGGLSVGPAKPLPEDIQSIADSATNGLVVVSFGSILTNVPEPVFMHLYKAFSQLTELTIVWKYSGPPLPDLPEHIHLLEWLPQNDLLGHPNTRLFITHCGNNGQFEALYHGVPMVGIPVFADQPYNANRMRNKGFGEAVALAELTSDKLLELSRKVLGDEKYTKAIKKASSMYRNQPMSAKDRAVYWVQYVLDYGTDHLVPPGVQLPWYQYWMLDVALFVFAVISFIVLIFALLVTYICRKLCCSSVKVKTS